MAKSCFYQVCRLLLSKSCCLPLITVICVLSLLLSSLQMESSLQLNLRTRFDKISPWATFHLEKSSSDVHEVDEKEVISKMGDQTQGKGNSANVNYLRAPSSDIIKNRAKEALLMKQKRQREKLTVERENIHSNDQVRVTVAPKVLESNKLPEKHRDNTLDKVVNVSSKIEALKSKLAKSPIGKKDWSLKQSNVSPKEKLIKTNLNPAALKETVNKGLGKTLTV